MNYNKELLIAQINEICKNYKIICNGIEEYDYKYINGIMCNLYSIEDKKEFNYNLSGIDGSKDKLIIKRLELFLKRAGFGKE